MRKMLWNYHKLLHYSIACPVMSEYSIYAVFESPAALATAAAEGDAMFCAVTLLRRDWVVALLAAGADANKKHRGGPLMVSEAAWRSAEILQLLIDAGGSVNELGDDVTPLIRLIMSTLAFGEDGAADRLGVLLAQPELDMDAKCDGKTAEQIAVEANYALELAAMIAKEIVKRVRWSRLRSFWVGALFL